MPSDILLEIIQPQIKGEGRDKDHPDTLEINSYNMGVMQEASIQMGAGLVAGGSEFHPLTVSKQLDISTVKLFQQLCAGARIDSMKMYVRRPGEGGATGTSNAPVDYLLYEFEGVQVLDMRCDGNSGSAIPDETWSFNYTRLKTHYREIKDGQAQGPVSMSYDIKTNKAV
jgi:type VI secretion system Hcp family effector